MAKKATIVQRMTDATNAVAEPGETPVASAYVVKGPNPYLVAILERTLVGVFGAYWLGWYRPYFVSLTDRRLLFFKLSLWTARSKGLDFAFPRDAVELVSSNRGRMWGAIRVKNSAG